MKQRPFEIVHEDEDVLLIDKKAGILSIPDRYRYEAENLYHLLKSYRENIYPLHRLDKETSGIMIYAKNEDAHKFLSEQFESRQIDKEYIAVVEGHPVKEKDTIETFLSFPPSSGKTVKVTRKGKVAITHYEVVEQFNRYALCNISIETGRQHQIRVHMSHIGHPLAVDDDYGRSEAIYAQDLKLRKFNQNPERPSRPLISRVSLHSHQLGFQHPSSKERVTYKAGLPKDMRALINQLRKWDALS